MPTKTEKQKVVNQLQQIDPYDFEVFIAELWEADGFETTVTQDSQDQGVDVYAERHGTVDQTIAIQAKRYSEGKKVGRPEIQQYAALKTQDSDVDSVAVVTTSSFTSGAKAWAYENNINLVDSDELADLVLKHERTDLLDRYAAGNVSVQAATKTKSGSKSDSSGQEIIPSREKTELPGYFLPITAALGLMVSSWVLLYFFPNNLIGWLLVSTIQPIAIPGLLLIDAIHLKRRKAKFQPSVIWWPLGAFMSFGLVGIWYWIRRARRTDIQSLYLDKYFG